MNSKQYAKVSLNQEKKTIRITKQVFNSKSSGEATLNSAKNFVILNQKGINKLLSQGWKIVDGITKVTNNITKVETTEEPWQPLDLTGEESTEESIRKYYVMKKQRQAVHFVKGLHSIKEKSYVSAKEVFGESKFAPAQPLTFHSAYDKFERTQIGRERKAQMTEVGV